MLNITINNINRTILNKRAFLKVIKKYSRGLNKDLIITFDNRLSCNGSYLYNNKKKKHVIKIEVSPNAKDNLEKVYLLLDTLLHEIMHAKQYERSLNTEHTYDFEYNSDFKDEELGLWYSGREIEARAYALKNLLGAVKIYDEYTRK